MKGQTLTRAYKSWESIKRKCYKPTCHSFNYYGGRGIIVCDSWLESFDNFYLAMGECPEGHTLGRIDNEGNYEPSNCRWETRKQQARNRSTTKLSEEDILNIRNLRNQSKLKLKDIAKIYNISLTTVCEIAKYRTWA